MMLSVRNLAKSYGALAVLRDISFDVAAGEILGIAGPNGSGKSTLFNVLTGIPVRADAGEIRFDTREIRHLSPPAIVALGLVRTFQRETAFETLTALENVLAGPLHALRTPYARARERAEAALDFVGFPPERVGRVAAELSVFDRKRLMIASALALAPKLCLFDEPVAGLAPPEIQAIMTILRRLRDRGAATILVEHVLPALLGVSDRLMVLHQGVVLATGRPQDVIRDSRVVDAYLGPGRHAA